MGQPNVLLFITDQQRADTVQAGGPCRHPNLRALAASGLQFTRAHTPNAICSPARASMLTGRYPSRHGMVDCTHTVEPYRARFDRRLATWSGRLAEAGYDGALFGKWHVERQDRPQDFGFGEYLPRGSDAYRQHRQELGLAARPQVVEPIWLRQPGYRDALLAGVWEEPAEATEPHFLTSQAGEFIRRQGAAGQPWFCMVSTIEPHDPFVAPRALADLYDPADIPLPATYDDELVGKPAILKRLRTVWADLSPDQVRRAAACYYAACTLLDHQVGRLVEVLEETGQRADTLLIFTTDHGELLGAHGLFLKGVPAYEEVYNIPLILAGAGVAARGTSDGLVNLVDLAPTIVELAGAQAIEDVDGHSLVPLLGEADPARRRELAAAPPWDEDYAEFHGQRFFYTQRLVWHDRYKYIFNGFDGDELYDLEADPGETRNLAGEPAYREVLAGMARRMWRRVHALGDHNLANAQYPMFRFAPVGPEDATSRM